MLFMKCLSGNGLFGSNSEDDLICFNDDLWQFSRYPVEYAEILIEHLSKLVSEKRGRKQN